MNNNSETKSSTSNNKDWYPNITHETNEDGEKSKEWFPNIKNETEQKEWFPNTVGGEKKVDNRDWFPKTVTNKRSLKMRVFIWFVDLIILFALYILYTLLRDEYGWF